MRKLHQNDNILQKQNLRNAAIVVDTKVLPIVAKQGFCDIIHRELPENPSGSVTRGLQSYYSSTYL